MHVITTMLNVHGRWGRTNWGIWSCYNDGCPAAMVTTTQLMLTID